MDKQYKENISKLKNSVRIEKTDRISTPYQVLLNDLVIALCPSEFTAMIVAGGLSYKIEVERRKTKDEKEKD